MSVTLDATSTPTIMSLTGTVFALAPAVDVDPPTTTATADPAPNANGWNKTMVNVTLAATDGFFDRLDRSLLAGRARADDDEIEVEEWH